MVAITRTPRGRWIEEGLRALAARGPDAVRVEALAQALGVTKGGFYGHFADRNALLEEMLDAWERMSTDEVVERVERQGGDVRARLRLAGALTFSSELLPIDLAIRDWSRRDQAVAGRLRRVEQPAHGLPAPAVRCYLRRRGRGRGPQHARLLTRDRPPLHGRRSRRAQPRRCAQACRQVALGVAAP